MFLFKENLYFLCNQYQNKKFFQETSSEIIQKFATHANVFKF